MTTRTATEADTDTANDHDTAVHDADTANDHDTTVDDADTTNDTDTTNDDTDTTVHDADTANDHDTTVDDADTANDTDTPVDETDTANDDADSDIVPTSPDARDRRGPFRPDRLITARLRQSDRLAAHGFRLVDLIVLTVITVLAVAIRSQNTFFDTPTGVVAPLVLAGLATGRLLRSIGLYRFGGNERAATHAGKVIGAAVAGGIVAAVGGFVIGSDNAPVDAALVWSGLAVAALLVTHVLWWSFVRRWRTQGRLTPNLVIVGATRHAERLIGETLERRDLNLLGVFDDRMARTPDDVMGVPVLGGTDALVAHRITPYVDRIVVAVDPLAQGRVREITTRLTALPNEVCLVVDSPDGSNRSDCLQRLADAPLAPLDRADDPDRRAFAKRVQDLLISLVGLIVLSPLVALIALAVRIDSPGPVFFRQRRHGFNHEEIIVWKFRTMRHETSDARAEQQVTADDERVTRVGRLLRTTSLDELPQLFNVLRGEMSIVGPRPHAVGMKTGETESALLVADYAQRHRIKPGMTGWAAINGSRGPLHSAEAVSRRVELDVHYIERQSFWLDLWIVALTVPNLLGDRSATR